MWCSATLYFLVFYFMASPGSLANTLFGSGTADDVLLVDPNAVTTNDPKTSFVSKVSNGLDTSASFLRKHSGLIRESASLVTDMQSKGMSPTDKFERLNGIFGKYGTSLTALSAPIQNSILSALPAGTAEMAVKIGVHAGNAYDTYQTVKDVRDVRGALDALERFTGDYGLGEIIDFSSEIAFLKVMNDEMVSLGHPGILDVIDERLNRDPSGNLRKDYYVATWDTYVRGSRVDQLRKILESIEPSVIMGYHPGTVRTLLSKYTFPSVANPSRYDELRTELLEVLNKLDINWGKYRRGSDWVWDLDAFSTMSTDATKLLQTEDLYRDPIAVARGYQSMDVVQNIKSMYPHFYFTD